MLYVYQLGWNQFKNGAVIIGGEQRFLNFFSAFIMKTFRGHRWAGEIFYIIIYVIHSCCVILGMCLLFMPKTYHYTRVFTREFVYYNIYIVFFFLFQIIFVHRILIFRNKHKRIYTQYIILRRSVRTYYPDTYLYTRALRIIYIYEACAKIVIYVSVSIYLGIIYLYVRWKTKYGCFFFHLVRMNEKIVR